MKFLDISSNPSTQVGICPGKMCGFSWVSSQLLTFHIHFFLLQSLLLLSFLLPFVHPYAHKMHV